MAYGIGAMESPRSSLVLVRHCATDWSASGRHTSHTDLSLSAAGAIDAPHIGARLQKLTGETFARIVASPRRRAQETCQRAGFESNVAIDDDLVEWDYGSYEGLTTPEIRATTPTWSLWDDGAPGGESPEDVQARADRFIERSLRHADSSLVFSHGHFLRVLTARWLALPVRDGRLFALDPGSISVLGFEREQGVIRQWNQVT